MNGFHRLTEGLDALGSTLLVAAAIALSASWLILLAAALSAVLGVGEASALLSAARPLAAAFAICAGAAFVIVGALHTGSREPVCIGRRD